MKKISYSTIVESDSKMLFDYLHKKELLSRIQTAAPCCDWILNKKYLGLWSCEVVEVSDTEAQLIDTVELTSWEYILFKKKVDSFFPFFHRIIQEDIRQLRNLGSICRKKVLIAGASGFVGKILCSIMALFGFEVYKLVRRNIKNNKEIFWDPQKQLIDQSALENFDVVINLSGRSIFALRWTQKIKKQILSSRVNTTLFLGEALSKLKHPPKLLISASAIGYYGNRNDEVLTESSSKGAGFLSQVAQLWEEAAEKQGSIPVMNARFGIVLGNTGGLLNKMNLPFKLGLGACLGDGDEWMSWIAVDDLAYQMMASIQKENIAGPINFVSPSPTTSKQFAQAFAKIYNKKVHLRVPRAFLQFVLGELSTIALASQKVAPKKLLESSCLFSYPSIEKTLKHYLNI